MKQWDGGERVRSGVQTHAGDLGDVIYGMLAMKRRGGQGLILHEVPGKTSHGMSRERAALLAPLIEAQSYVGELWYSPVEVHGAALDGFRAWRGGGRNLAEMAMHAMGVAAQTAELGPWLTVPERRREARVVVARSARYTMGGNADFPWAGLVGLFGEDAVGFVGLAEEHEAFQRDWGVKVRRIETRDFLELAEVIAGADLFIGNQSSPHAVAVGLGQAVVQEGAHFADTCRMGWKRQVIHHQGDQLTVRQVVEAMEARALGC